MDLNRALENKALYDLLDEYIKSFWYDFHGSHINDEDEAQEYLHAFIDNAVIYTHDCEKILEGNSEYHYDDHDTFGRPTNIAQAAYACVYDYFESSPDYTAMINEFVQMLYTEEQVFNYCSDNELQD